MANLFGGMVSGLGVGAAAALCGWVLPIAVPVVLVGSAVLWDREREREEATRRAETDARQRDVNAMRDTLAAMQAELAAVKAAGKHE